jgi:sugar/nucleoside kinase (ribokinase family)
MLVSVGDLYEEILVQLPAEPPHGHVTRVRSARVRGGSAANIAAITSEQGAPSRFVGRVGADRVGRSLVEDLSRRGVELAVQHSGGTGVAVTLVGGGRRTSLVDRGASARLDAIDTTVLDGAEQVYVPASSLVSDPAAGAIQTLLADASARRIPIVLGSLSTADIDSYGAEAFLAFVSLLRPDAVIANREEHDRLGLDPGRPLPGAMVTVLTDGERPARVLNERGLCRDVAAHRVERVRDRTGVGDGFTAGYLRARRDGAEAVSAVDAGHRVAAMVLRELGPTTGRA